MRFFRPNVQKLFEKKDGDGLAKALTDPEKEIRVAAAKGLGMLHYGMAVPQLCAALKDHAPVVRRAAADALGLIGGERPVDPLIDLLHDIAPEVRQSATDALRKIGPPAVRALCKSLTSDNAPVRLSAVQILAQIGDSRVVKPLCNLLNDPDANVRQAAAKALVKFGAASLEPLCAALRDKDAAVRAAAAEAIERIGVPGDPVTQAWMTMARPFEWERIARFGTVALDPLFLTLTHPKVTMRTDAIRALGEIHDERVLEPLLKCLSDPEREVRDAVAYALVRLRDSRVLTPLIDMMARGKPIEREAAATALGFLGDVRAVIPLINMLRDEVGAVSMAASEALIRIGPGAEQALVTIIINGPASMRKLAAETLEKIGVPNDPKVQVWMAVLHNNWVWARSYGELAVVPAVAALRDPDQHIRCAAVELLGDLRDIRTIIPLCQLLRDPHPDVRTTVSKVLGKMGKFVVEPLLDALEEDDWQIRLAAARGLGSTGDQRALEPLSRALHDKDSRVREMVARSIEQLGFPLDPASECWYVVAKQDWDKTVALGQHALEPLRNALHDPVGKIRQDAVEALGRVGDPSVISAVRALLADEEWYVRDSALKALEQLRGPVATPQAG